MNHTAPVPPSAVLAGFELEMRCLPEAGACNSNAVWPSKLELRITEAGASFFLSRAWTPGRGGGKPLSAALQYNVTLHWLDFGGSGRAERFEREHALHRPAGWARGGRAGLRGFGFEFTAQPQAGRYIEGLAFGVRPDGAAWQWRADVWAPRTVHDTTVKSWVEVVDLPQAPVRTGELNGTVCADDRAAPYSFRCAKHGLPAQLSAAVPVPVAPVLV